jgi:hypothetical protein
MAFNALKFFRNQKGGFSPYMFGLLVGISAFSTITAHYARKEMIKSEQRKIEQQKAEAEDLKNALEVALLTETDATYDADLSLNRARAHTTLSTAKTRGGSDVTLNIVNSETSLGIQGERVLITTTDDDFTKTAVGLANSAAAQAGFTDDNAPVTMFDSGAARNRQVDISVQNMEMEAAQIYAFYAGELRFPGSNEYDAIQAVTGLKDFWGNDFSYTIVTSPTHVRIEFTTPWSYTERIDMQM